MKVIHALVGLLLFLILAATGVALVYVPWARPELWAEGMDLIANQYWMASVAGGPPKSIPARAEKCWCSVPARG